MRASEARRKADAAVAARRRARPPEDPEKRKARKIKKAKAEAARISALARKDLKDILEGISSAASQGKTKYTHNTEHGTYDMFGGGDNGDIRKKADSLEKMLKRREYTVVVECKSWATRYDSDGAGVESEYYYQFTITW